MLKNSVLYVFVTLSVFLVIYVVGALTPELISAKDTLTVVIGFITLSVLVPIYIAFVVKIVLGVLKTKNNKKGVEENEIQN
jgi:hypothetical protein